MSSRNTYPIRHAWAYSPNRCLVFVFVMQFVVAKILKYFNVFLSHKGFLVKGMDFLKQLINYEIVL